MGSSVILPATGQPGPQQPGEFASAAVPNVVTFGFEGIGPPSPLYIQRDDQLVIEAATTTATSDLVFVTARLLLPVAPSAGQPVQGAGGVPTAVPQRGSTIIPIVFTATAGANGVLTATTIPLAEGYLLSVGVTGNTALKRGTTFVRVWINRGAVSTLSPNAATVLIADYVTQTAVVGWPYGRVLSPPEGPGNVKNVPIGAPGAGVDWTTTQPGGVRWRLQSWNAQLVTSATVANRIVRGFIKTGGGSIVWQGSPSAVIPASQTVQVSAASGQFTASTDPATVGVALPSPAMVNGAFIIGVSTTGLQAGDQWSGIQLHVEEWLDG